MECQKFENMQRKDTNSSTVYKIECWKAKDTEPVQSKLDVFNPAAKPHSPGQAKNSKPGTSTVQPQPPNKSLSEQMHGVSKPSAKPAIQAIFTGELQE